MIKFEQQSNHKTRNSKVHSHNNSTNNNSRTYTKLAVMGKRYKRIINELSSPIDATNRFINLALQSIGEHSQGRQFLLESKQGLRKTVTILNKLNEYTKRIEKEIRDISRQYG